MQFTVPHRTVADTGSFPVNPNGVVAWLKELRPTEAESDARELYRGLKHSNRLHNDVDQRRAVLSCFIPVLRELHTHLSELSHAQPLPLTRPFSRSARLRDALLREEAFAFKILLSDSEQPQADDARRAMQALARQAESVAHAYRRIPDALIRDAHQLYTLAEKHRLSCTHQGSERRSLQDHYRFILLLAVSDLTQQRARQLQLIIDFLRNTVADIHIEKNRSIDSLQAGDFAINLSRGSRPEPARSLLVESTDELRWFSIAPLLYRIDRFSSRIRPNPTTVLGSDVLERQSLARLHVALSRTRQRRSARLIVSQPRRIVFGHKEVCAHLLYRPDEPSPEDYAGWTVINQSDQGMCLVNSHCRAGLAQVGELISITEPDKPLRSPEERNNSKINAPLGVVRWVHARGSEGICLGVEILAISMLPVNVTRDEALASNALPDQPSEKQQRISEHALIIACKIQKTHLQTILLPCYLYQSGDRLIASQGGRSRPIKLRRCLQTNGLFSQYSLSDG